MDDQLHFLRCTGDRNQALQFELEMTKLGHVLAMLSAEFASELAGIDGDVPKLPKVPWDKEEVDNSTVRARMETLQEKDVRGAKALGERLRKEVEDFTHKSEIRTIGERARWREALDQDPQLRIPHTKFRCLLKSERAARQLETRRKEEEEEKKRGTKEAPTGQPSTPKTRAAEDQRQPNKGNQPPDEHG